MRIFEINEDAQYQDWLERWKIEPERYEIEALYNAVKLIAKECKPFLKQVDYDPFNEYAMFRGIRYTDETLLKKEIRVDGRMPKDTPDQLHNKLNAYFQHHYGENWRDSIFVTGDDGQAEFYGRSHLTFPIGDFKFLWSPMIRDLNSIVTSAGLGDVLSLVDYDDPRAKEFKDNFWSAFGKLEHEGQYRDTDLKAGIESMNEVMIRGYQYYAIPTKLFSKINPKAFMELLAHEI